MPNCGDKNYWEERYDEQSGTTFDWLEDYESIKPIIDNLGIKKEYRILNVGCGNSEFSEKMFDEGYTHNYNIDICQNVIDFMRNRNRDKKGLHFDVMDVCEMAYKDETFDLIIDKSTTDALLCADHSFMIVAKMLKEISRVLKTGGYYLIISYGQPENRMIHLERDHLAFDIQIYTIKRQDEEEEKEKIHYVYICKNVIDFMKSRNKERKGLHFDVMDVCEMAYKDETFDLIIDKSTIDALLCGDHSFMIVAKMLKEISRVLKTGGYYIIVSYGKPENRMTHLERDHLAFDIQIYTIKRKEDEDESEKIHYVYICKKLTEANENLNNFDLVYKELEQEELEGAEDEEEQGQNKMDDETKEEYLSPGENKKETNVIKESIQ